MKETRSVDRCSLPALGLFLLLLTGCHLGRPGSASFASIVIPSHSREEILAVTGQVFRDDGYRARTTDSGKMIFEKEGSRANDIAFNGVVGTHYGAQTLVRVKTDIVELNDGTKRLQCQAYMVRDAGDAFFEEESRLSNFRGGPYQKLLDQVARKLKQP
jgi:hypothetical protein